MDGGELVFSTTSKSQVMSEGSSACFILRFKLFLQSAHLPAILFLSLLPLEK